VRFLLWSFYAHPQGYVSPTVSAKGTIYLPTFNDTLGFSAIAYGVPLGRTPWPKFRGDLRNTGNAQNIP